MKSFTEYLVEERITTTFNLKGLYDDFNRTLFSGELPDVPIAFGKTPKGAAGVTNSRATRKAGMPVWMRATVPGSISVTINPYTYEQDVLKGIVAHEMVHVWCMHTNRHERDAHGPAFQAKVGEIQRKASFTIPIKHNTEDEEHGAPREVGFIATVYNGKHLLTLIAKSATDKPDTLTAAQAVCDYMVARRGSAWAAYGMCKTPLANTLQVRRELNIKRPPDPYRVESFKLLGVQRLFYMNGTPDFN
jgi:hypothetical protein